jgi:hypothetical protein
MTIDRLDRIARVLDIQLSVVARWRGGELDRLLNARHSAMHEAFARIIASHSGWISRPEVSYSIYGERGLIDALAWHEATRSLLVVELKTELADAQELVGVLDRKRRLAPRIARGIGWEGATTSVWVAVAAHRSNRRAIEEHRAFLASAFPDAGRVMRGWFRSPFGSVAAISTWSFDPAPSRRGGPARVRTGRAKPSASLAKPG